MVGRMHVITRTYWAVLLYIIVPVCCIAMCLTAFINAKAPVTETGERFPIWTIGFGWSIAALTLMPIPGFAIYEIYQSYPDFRAVSVSVPSS
ncbi:unnamed protein product [Protopolystoma xenopodis]|uniref:Uncharacterized protein n=1 Tax=Protopolystoma xenopodis TaxID=117903 RepID=A0A3S5A3V4_9PLAT|nr:unnamed protein product [Protopolystoma xenopodis]